MRTKKNSLSFSKKKKGISPKVIKEIISWLSITAIAIILAIALVLSFGMKVSVIGDSMEPLIYNGQGVLVDRLLSKIISPKTGEVVVFLPNGNVNSHYYVKRVVATPGETVQIIDGTLYINGKSAGEDSTIYDKIEDPGIAESPIKLESGEYFVLGDNRNSSEDSRSPNIGVVKTSMIIGKAWFMDRYDDHSGGFLLNTY